MSKFRRYRKRGGKTSIAKKALRLAKKNKKLLKDVEWKHVDTSTTATLPASSGGDIIPLNLTAQGLDDNDRIGKEIRTQNLAFRFHCYSNASAGINHVRLIIFRDRSSDGTAPTTVEVLDTNSCKSFRNLKYTDRFKVYYDKTFKLSSASSIDASDQTNYIAKFFRMGFRTGYTGTTAVQSAIDEGALYAMVLGSLGTNMSGYNLDTRVRFTDL